MSVPDEQAAYRVTQVEDPDWLRQHFKAEPAGDDILIRGLCPRCGHHVDKRVTSVQMRAFAKESGSSPSTGGSPSAARAMKCNCLDHHPGRESGQGCGAWWGLKLKPRK